jgi:hypothetical protein
MKYNYLTDRSKEILEKLDKEYLKAWKAGHNIQESETIALNKINEDGRAILRALRDADVI